MLFDLKFTYIKSYSSGTVLNIKTGITEGSIYDSCQSQAEILMSSYGHNYIVSPGFRNVRYYKQWVKFFFILNKRGRALPISQCNEHSPSNTTIVRVSS